MSKHRREPDRLGRKPGADAPADAAPSPAAAPQHAAPPAPEPAPLWAATPAPKLAPKPAPKPAKQPRPAAVRRPAATGSRPSGRSSTYRPPAGTAATYRSLAGTRAVLVVALVVSFFFLLWLAWAVWVHSTPKVQSTLLSFEIDGPNLAVATVDVTLGKGTSADCVVQALADDHSVVGEVHFVPQDGSNRVSINTERNATSVNLVGCTAPGQNQPR